MTTLVKPTPSNNFVRGFIVGEHRGMDWGWQMSRVEVSMRILAAAAGKVVEVYSGSGFNGGWGRRIVIDHGKGAKTTYNHIRPGGIRVSVGQSVAAGQHIADMGSSGASTGTHLHFELYLNGVRVNPQPYFTKHLPGTAPAPAGRPAGWTLDLGNTQQPWYRSAGAAAIQKPKHGRGRGEILLTGPYPVLAKAKNGALKVRSRSMGDVWLNGNVRKYLR